MLRIMLIIMIIIGEVGVIRRRIIISGKELLKREGR